MFKFQTGVRTLKCLQYYLLKNFLLKNHVYHCYRSGFKKLETKTLQKNFTNFKAFKKLTFKKNAWIVLLLQYILI